VVAVSQLVAAMRHAGDGDAQPALDELANQSGPSTRTIRKVGFCTRTRASASAVVVLTTHDPEVSGPWSRDGREGCA